jgi:hypothetical protein
LCLPLCLCSSVTPLCFFPLVLLPCLLTSVYHTV